MALFVCSILACAPYSKAKIYKLSSRAIDGVYLESTRQVDYWYDYYLTKYKSEQIAYDSTVVQVGRHFIQIKNTKQLEVLESYTIQNGRLGSRRNE